MIFGYSRADKPGQQLHAQITALQEYGCEEIVQEQAPGLPELPVLHQLLARLRPGDILVVYTLARLSYSLAELVALIIRFQQQDIHFVSLQDRLDTTAQGQLLFDFFHSLAQFERDIDSCQRYGPLLQPSSSARQTPRPKGLSRAAYDRAQTIKALYFQENKTVEEISRLLGIRVATVHRYLLHLGI